MRTLQLLLLFFGRIFLSLIFILSAVHKLAYWQDAKEGLVHMLYNWQIVLQSYPDAQGFFSASIYFAPVFLALAIALELFGSVLILLGWKARLGAACLIIFLVPTTIIFHHFWYFDGLKRDIEFVMFLKNIAILGGLLYILVHGSSIKKLPAAPVQEEQQS